MELVQYWGARTYTKIERSLANPAGQSDTIDLGFLPERPSGPITRSITFPSLADKRTVSGSHYVTTVSHQYQPAVLHKNWVVTYREEFTIGADRIFSDAKVLSIIEDGISTEPYETEPCDVATDSDPAFQQIWARWSHPMALKLTPLAPSPYEPIQQFW